jgi:putative spermidine/putrescine transport system permease protein
VILPVVNTLIALYLLAPVLVVVATSVTTTAYPVFPPHGFTLRWFEEFLRNPEFMSGMRLSALLALTATSIATCLGTAAALGLARGPRKPSTALTGLFLSPIVFPAIVLGLALLIFYSRIGLSGRFAGMVAAHVLLVTPFVVRLVAASLAEFDDSVEEAARNLGATWPRVFFQVTLPIIRPGIVAGAVFAFIISFDELVVTLFLAGPGLQTLPIRIYSFVQYNSTPVISAISTALIAAWVVMGVPLYVRFLGIRHA